MSWQSLFVPPGSVFEVVIRGSIMYLLLFAALRFLVRRPVGSMSLMDLLLMVLIADAAQNGMAGQYNTITEGIVLCGTLFAWNFFLDWLAYQSKFIRRLLEPPPLPVIRDGRFLLRNMRQELVTKEELMSHLREQEIDDVRQVKLACIEPDGGISVRKAEGGKGPSHSPHHSETRNMM